MNAAGMNVAGAIKICGLTRIEDARLAVEFGADALGFVLFSGSPRFIEPVALARLTGALSGGALKVGVFVDPVPEEAFDTARLAGLDVVQIHGCVSERGFVDAPVAVWRAVRCGAAPVAAADLWAVAAAHVVDAAVPGLHGGTGRCADWTQARELARRVPVVLAGGLTPETVEAGIEAVAPCGVDVSSGVEASPGRKDAARLAAFVRNARRAFDRVAEKGNMR